MDESILVPLSLFLMIAVIVWLVTHFRFRAKQELMTTMRTAIEAGQPVSAQTLAELSTTLFNKRNDLRRGLVFIAVGLGFLVFGFSVDDSEANDVLMGLSAFPFFIGIAYLIVWFMHRNEDNQSTPSQL